MGTAAPGAEIVGGEAEDLEAPVFIILARRFQGPAGGPSFAPFAKDAISKLSGLSLHFCRRLPFASLSMSLH